MDLINTCLETTANYRTIAYYSHLIPVAIALFLGFFVLIKSKYSLLSKIFLFFTASFSLWLIGDVITWTSNNYNFIVAVWAPLDYINVVFFLLAAYFFIALVREKDIVVWQKIILMGLSTPAWWIAFSGGSITGFNQPQCEAFNNQWLINYKLVIEVLVIAFITIYWFHSFLKVAKEKRKQITVVALGLVLFLMSFMSTEYIAGQTGIYEINLYSLFVLPLFLILIIFAITNLRIFQMRTFGTQLLTYILLIMVGSQFFFLENGTDQILTVLTFAISVFLGVTLLRNVSQQEKARLKIEKLASDLQKANEGQTNLIHIMNHQIKGYLAKARGIFSELMSEPAYGPISDVAKPMIKEGFESLTEGVGFVQQVLNGSSAESGTLVYSMKQVDIKSIVEEVSSKEKEKAEKKGLTFDVTIADGNYTANADAIHIKESVRNLIENSIIYTPAGGLTIHLEKVDDKIRFSVKDTGLGITAEDKAKLFTKGGRGKDSLKVNVNSTGYGLAFVKGVAEAHKGHVWVESEGAGKGSTFYLELQAQS